VCFSQVELRNMATGQLSVFDVKSWFSKKKGELVKDIPAKERGKLTVDSTALINTYKYAEYAYNCLFILCKLFL